MPRNGLVPKLWVVFDAPTRLFSTHNSHEQIHIRFNRLDYWQDTQIYEEHKPLLENL